MTAKVLLNVCVGAGPRRALLPGPCRLPALPLNPIRKLIGKPWVLGSGPQPRWLMGLPDAPAGLINGSGVLP